MSVSINIAKNGSFELPADIPPPKFRLFQRVRFRGDRKGSTVLVGMTWIDDGDAKCWFYAWGDGNSATAERDLEPID